MSPIYDFEGCLVSNPESFQRSHYGTRVSSEEYTRIWAVFVMGSTPPPSSIYQSEHLPATERYMEAREYWMIFRGPGFLAVVCFGSSPTPSQLSQEARTATRRKSEKERQLADGRRGGGWGRNQIIWQRESLVLYKSMNHWSYYRPLT